MDSMTSASGPSELGAFLKARRARLTPQDFGLPETDSRRKVGGLRREEVAALAAISVDYGLGHPGDAPGVGARRP
jgi:hypothetical protein